MAARPPGAATRPSRATAIRSPTPRPGRSRVRKGTNNSTPSSLGRRVVKNLVSLKVLPGAVAEAVTDANIDQAVPALRPAVDALMQRAGGVLEGDPTQVAYAGLPGLRFEASSTGADPVVHLQGTWLFDGTTAYTFTCQFVPSGAEEVWEACDLVLKSFKTSN